MSLLVLRVGPCWTGEPHSNPEMKSNHVRGAAGSGGGFVSGIVCPRWHVKHVTVSACRFNLEMESALIRLVIWIIVRATVFSGFASEGKSNSSFDPGGFAT